MHAILLFSSPICLTDANKPGREGSAIMINMACDEAMTYNKHGNLPFSILPFTLLRVSPCVLGHVDFLSIREIKSHVTDVGG